MRTHSQTWARRLLPSRLFAGLVLMALAAVAFRAWASIEDCLGAGAVEKIAKGSKYTHSLKQQLFEDFNDLEKTRGIELLGKQVAGQASDNIGKAFEMRAAAEIKRGHIGIFGTLEEVSFEDLHAGFRKVDMTTSTHAIQARSKAVATDVLSLTDIREVELRELKTQAHDLARRAAVVTNVAMDPSLKDKLVSLEIDFLENAVNMFP